MKISIKNVCNVKESLLSISKNKLNIKYGNNGIGKTSITKAIDFKVNEVPMRELTPYGTKEKPEVEFILEDGEHAWSIDHTFIFNELYSSKNLFRRDDAVRDTFEIVVKNENYERDLSAIHESLKDVITIIDNSQFFTTFKADMAVLKEQVRVNSDGSFYKRSGLVEGLLNGYSVASVSNGNPFKKHLEKVEDAADWSDWFIQGDLYTDNDRCPYCNNLINTSIHECQQEIRDKVAEGGLAKTMKSLTYVELLCKYLPSDVVTNVMGMIKTESPLSDSEQKYIYEQCYKPLISEYEKILDISKNNSYDELLKKVHNNSLNNTLIEDKLFVEDIFSKMVQSLSAEQEAITYNKAIDELIEASEQLAHELYDLNETIRKNIQNNQDFVNEFLDNAGLPYEVKIENIDGSYKTRLYPKGLTKIAKTTHPEDGLSYGERNSLSLLLFALEAKNLNPNDNYIIILDDPISSFDDHKKYALLHQLFAYRTDESGNVINNLRNKTVLMVTHDFQIAVDLVKKDLLGLVNYDLIDARYIRNFNGIQKDVPVTKDSFQNRIAYELSKAKDETSPIISRMLHYRRFLEVRGGDVTDKNQYSLISSFLHGKDVPSDIEGKSFHENEVLSLESKISKVLKGFKYQEWLSSLTKEKLVEDFYKETTSGLEKLEITRFFVQRFHLEGSMEKVFWKYLTETYHIDNDTLSVLDDAKYDATPTHLIDKCAEIVK